MLTEKNTRFHCLFVLPRDALLKLCSFVEAHGDYMSEKGPRQQGGLILYTPPTFLSTQYTKRKRESIVTVNSVLNIVMYTEKKQLSRRTLC